MDEVLAFLREHAPFDGLDEDAVRALAASAEIAYFPAGETIFAQGAEPREHVHVVRAGAVELLDAGRVLDLLGPGELFGYASMLAELPTGFAARAHEDTLCYLLPGTVTRPLLARPESLRYLARGLVARDRLVRDSATGRLPAHRPVSSLLRGEALVVDPDTTVAEAARRITETGQTAAVVRLEGRLGILTDRDLRSGVLAAGLPGSAPVRAVMTDPAYCVPAAMLADEALLEMLHRGVRHLPVEAPDGRLLGLIDDLDLLLAEQRSPFRLRQAIARAADVPELARAATGLRPTVLALDEAGLPAREVMAMLSIVQEAITRRLIELAVEQEGPPPVPFAWLALGSVARREAVPTSDQDSALVWNGADRDPVNRAYASALAQRVIEGQRACGLQPCPKNAIATSPLFARSLDAWRAALDGWFADPGQDKALMIISLIVDGRAIWGANAETSLHETILAGTDHPRMLRLLARFALSHRPPTGFLRDRVVEHSGRHGQRLDLKDAGLLPIVDLARWAGISAGETAPSTRERLRAAGGGGVLDAADARTLAEAFDLLCGLRIEAQVEQLREGREPDDLVDPSRLNPLTRSYLRDAFRAVAAVQRRISGELQFAVR
jgi:CBS domain-containing protein